MEIADVRRVNSGAMLLMLNPRGADNIAGRIARTAREKKGPLSPWHFDVALKRWLIDRTTNKDMRACYIFLPVGNYTTHTSGCDTTFATGAGQPNCWAENWCCPGTTLAEDPQKRPKRLMAWDGDKCHEEVGSAIVDEDLVGHLLWLSWWQGGGQFFAYLEQQERHPQSSKKKPAAAGSAKVEPAATLRGAKGKGKGKKKSKQHVATTQDVVRQMGSPKGEGKEPPLPLWQNRPGVRAEPLASDPIDDWTGDGNDDDDYEQPQTAKRQRRHIHSVLLNRTFRSWVRTRAEVHAQTY